MRQEIAKAAQRTPDPKSTHPPTLRSSVCGDIDPSQDIRTVSHQRTSFSKPQHHNSNSPPLFALRFTDHSSSLDHAPPRSLIVHTTYRQYTRRKATQHIFHPSRLKRRVLRRGRVERCADVSITLKGRRSSDFSLGNGR